MGDFNIPRSAQDRSSGQNYNNVISEVDILDGYMCTGIGSKWIGDLNINHKTTKMLEENMGEFLYDMGVRKTFLIMALKSKVIKEKVGTFDYIK